LHDNLPMAGASSFFPPPYHKVKLKTGTQTHMVSNRCARSATADEASENVGTDAWMTNV